MKSTGVVKFTRIYPDALNAIIGSQTPAMIPAGTLVGTSGDTYGGLMFSTMVDCFFLGRDISTSVGVEAVADGHHYNVPAHTVFEIYGTADMRRLREIGVLRVDNDMPMHGGTDLRAPAAEPEPIYRAEARMRISSSGLCPACDGIVYEDSRNVRICTNSIVGQEYGLLGSRTCRNDANTGRPYAVLPSIGRFYLEEGGEREPTLKEVWRD